MLLNSVLIHGGALGILMLLFNCVVVFGQTYNQCQNLNSPGVGDIASGGLYGPAVNSLQACMTLCGSTAGCIGAVYYNGQCFLKNTDVLTVAVAGLSPATYFIQTPYTCPSVGSSFISTQYIQCPNLDNPTIGNIPINGVAGPSLATVDVCMEACASAAGCIGAVYYQSRCWAKGTGILPTPVASLSGATYFITAGPGYRCPAVGGTFISTQFIQCSNLDSPTVGTIPINGVTAPTLGTVQDCMNACGSTAGCLGAVYYQSRCWAKGTGILTAPVASLSGANYVITAGYGCPAVGSSFGSTKYTQCSNIDNPTVGSLPINGAVGPSLPALGDCMQACTTVAGCAGAVYYQGRCWLKGTDIITTPVATLSPATYIVLNTYGCPAVGNTFISTKYVQCSNLDTPGVGDIAVNGAYGLAEPTLDACMNLCATTSGCIAGIQYDGHCFPKSSAILSTSTVALSPDTYFINLGHTCPTAGGAFN